MNAKTEDQLRSEYLSGRKRYSHYLAGKRQESFVYSESAVIQAGTQQVSQELKIQGDAFFLVEGVQIFLSNIYDSSTATQWSVFDFPSVQFSDTTQGQTWSSDYVRIFDAGGFGPSPRYLACPTLLRPSSIVTCNIKNNTINSTVTSGNNSTMYFNLVGRKVFGLSEEEAQFMLRRMHYQYALELPDLAAGAVGQVSRLQTFNDSDFVNKKLLGCFINDFERYYAQNTVENSGVAGTGSQEILGIIRDITSDYNWFDQKIPLELILGAQAANPAGMVRGSGLTLSEPIVVARNSVLEGEFDNQSGQAFPSIAATGLLTELSPFQIVMEGGRVF